MSTSSNLFAALAAKKKKPSASTTKKEKPAKKVEEAQEPQISSEDLDREIFSQPTLGVSNWADDSDEDDGFAAPSARAALEPVEPGWSKASERRASVGTLHAASAAFRARALPGWGRGARLVPTRPSCPPSVRAGHRRRTRSGEIRSACRRSDQWQRGAQRERGGGRGR